MIDSVPLIQNANDAQQINASIIAMKKASRELDEKIVKLNSLNSELDKKIALLDSGLNKEIEDRKEAINSLDVPSVGGSGKYISAISETDGKINATASDLATSVTSGNSQPVTSGGVAEYVGSMEFITDANNAIPPNNKDKTYYIYYNGTNIPINAYNFVITAYNGRATDGENQRRLVQMAYSTSNDNYGVVFTRLAFSSDGGETWTWRSWEKFIKQNEVTTSVASDNYSPIASSGVYSFLISSLRVDCFRLFKYEGNGTQQNLVITNSSNDYYSSVAFLVVSRYSVSMIHIEVDANGKFFQEKQNVLMKRDSGTVTITNTDTEITITDGVAWNSYLIVVFSNSKTLLDGLQFSLT